MKKWSLFILTICLLSILSIVSKATTETTAGVYDQKVDSIGQKVAYDEGAGPASVKKI
jgi:hypothetical protein